MTFNLPRLAPSILAADFSRLREQINECEAGGATWLHCDIMDGHFVPNISYGPDIVAAAKRSAGDMFIDVHLMIEEPDRYIGAFSNAGADLISVHIETCPHLHRTIQLIRQKECLAGIAINPATPVELLEPIANHVDMIVVMSVNPGFGGQTFIEGSYEKIQRLVRMRQQAEKDYLIEVDGGVNLSNIRKLVSTGADILVAGSTVFRSDDISDRVAALQKQAEMGRRNAV